MAVSSVSTRLPNARAVEATANAREAITALKILTVVVATTAVAMVIIKCKPLFECSVLCFSDLSWN